MRGETAPTKKTCLVLGGGLVGLGTINNLRKLVPSEEELEIVLVEPRQYFEVTWTAFRTPFDKDAAEKCLFDLEAQCQKKKVLHKPTIVTELTAENATLGTGEVVEFDACLVAVGAGSRWEACGRGPPPEGNSSRQGRLERMAKDGKALVDASPVLIVGGGLVGSELAGDVAFAKKEAGKDIHVTVVQSGSQLCPELDPGAATLVKSKLEKLGVKVLLDDRVVFSDDDKKTAKLESSGEVLEAEEVVMATGIHSLNRSFVKDESWMDERGWLKVNDHWNVVGTEKVFAMGDCCNLLPNSGTQTFANYAIVAHNLKVVMFGGGDKTTMKKYNTRSPEIFCCTVGPKDGVFCANGWCTTTWIIPAFKNSTLFLSTARGELDL